MGDERGDRRVDFLVAGVQKGGTTALHAFLGDVPGIGMATPKEPHFFDNEDTVDWEAPDYAAYHALFPPDAPLWGEATPIYLYWPPALERIRAYRPDMKFVVMLRDPVARAYSHWQMEYARGAETEPFAWCIREGRSRVLAGQQRVPGHHRVFSYVERGFYGAQLARLFAFFPREQLYIADATALKNDPTAVVAGICRFLGLPPPPPLTPRIVHAAASVTYPSIVSAEDHDLLRSTYEADQRLLRLIIAEIASPASSS